MNSRISKLGASIAGQFNEIENRFEIDRYAITDLATKADVTPIFSASERIPLGFEYQYFKYFDPRSRRIVLLDVKNASEQTTVEVEEEVAAPPFGDGVFSLDASIYAKSSDSGACGKCALEFVHTASGMSIMKIDAGSPILSKSLSPSKVIYILTEDGKILKSNLGS